MKFFRPSDRCLHIIFMKALWFSVLKAEYNPCSDRETCTFYRFPKYLKNSHNGMKIVLNRYAFVPLAYGMPVYASNQFDNFICLYL